jgi:hypothetical protein
MQKYKYSPYKKTADEDLVYISDEEHSYYNLFPIFIPKYIVLGDIGPYII